MKVTTLARLAVKHAANTFAESVYLTTGYDMTRPVTFYGLVNERCNIKCRYCEYWRLPNYVEEMTIEEWQQALLSVKAFVGEFSISFSGGEPFIKKGFLELMVWCHENGIHAGVTTNGSAFTQRNIEKILDAHPFNVNVSCDAPCAEVHDYVRGNPGLFEKLSAGVQELRKARDARGMSFPIVIKSVVHAANFRLLPDLVYWAGSIGATAVNFQPMDEWTPETKDELWIKEENYSELELILKGLVKMKRRGAPIVNSDQTLELILPHFRKEKAPESVLPCRVGMRDFFIRANGDVEVCFFYPPIGNIKEQNAKAIWYGEKAQKVRKETVECDRLCLYTCLSQKTLADKVRMGLKLLTRQSEKAHSDWNQGHSQAAQTAAPK
jgi:MoaA/NifB/PqqE/SkfB family radical SAM enzyme